MQVWELDVNRGLSEQCPDRVSLSVQIHLEFLVEVHRKVLTCIFWSSKSICLQEFQKQVHYRKTGIFIDTLIVFEIVVNNFIPILVYKT